MAKTTPQPQGVFSFFDDVEKNEPAPKPKRNTLRPPEIIEEPPSQPSEVNEANTAIEEKAKVTEPVTIEPIEEEIIPKNIAATEPPATETLQAAELQDVVEKENEEVEVVEEQQKQTYIKNDESHKKTEAVSTRGRRSVKENSLAADMIEMPDDEVLFQKQYYSMKEVTTMFNENHSLIRYWETEFDILKPRKNGKGDRFFRPVDVKNLYLIYDLLRRRKFTIEGAREYLKNDKKADEKFTAVQSLKKIKTLLLELKAGL
ncbi:MAG: MerR family transcriptional regulator [Niabella sp.]